MIRYFDLALFAGPFHFHLGVNVLNVSGDRRYRLLGHEKQFLLVGKRFLEPPNGVRWKLPRVKKPMVLGIQGEFRCGPGVDQEDILGVTPNCAGYLTPE